MLAGTGVAVSWVNDAPQPQKECKLQMNDGKWFFGPVAGMVSAVLFVAFCAGWAIARLVGFGAVG